MRLLFALLVFAVATFAESFGGIGVTIQFSEKGVQIVTVMPGSPASLKGLQPGDQIVSVDGVTLEGKALESATAMLRGTAGAKVQISVSKAKDGEIWTGEITRANLQVQEFLPQDIASWYQNSSSIQIEEVEHLASQKAQAGFQLLGILQYGKLVASGEKLAPQKVSSVYIGSMEPERPSIQIPLVAKIDLLAFSRKELSFQLNVTGTLDISVYNLQGEEIQRWSIAEAQPGAVSVAWDRNHIPGFGSYVVRARQGSASRSWEVQLR